MCHLVMLCHQANHMVPHAVLLVQVDGRVVCLDAAVQLLSIPEPALSLKLVSLLCVDLLHVQKTDALPLLQLLCGLHENVNQPRSLLHLPKLHLLLALHARGAQRLASCCIALSSPSHQFLRDQETMSPQTRYNLPS